ncbi:protein-disulfide reductase DsbD domain-containing protein [Arcicella aurantiaca]|nr:protein-disulfide reductase DsbD domain-containing protein [Arcicella aurantiaca]
MKPAKFTFTSNKTTPKIGETLTLIFTATIEKEWKLYATDNSLNPGPIPIEASFTQNDAFELVGKLQAIKPQKHFDDYWKGNVSYFIGTAKFTQKVKIKKLKAVIEGKIKYQTCTLKDGSCVIGKDKFSYSF